MVILNKNMWVGLLLILLMGFVAVNMKSDTKSTTDDTNATNEYERYTVDRLVNLIQYNLPHLPRVDVKPHASKTFSRDKRIIYIKVWDETNQCLYPDNTLIHALLHEYSHVITSVVGHGQEFIDNFQKLEHQAHIAGIYDPYAYFGDYTVD